MLNCGAVVDVEGLISINGRTVYVIDSHRPFHPTNLNSKSVLLIGTEGTLSKDNKENEPLKLMNEDEDEEPINENRKRFDFDESDDEEEEEDDDDENMEDLDDMEGIDEFATSYNTCISMLLYDLASRLNKTSNEILLAWNCRIYRSKLCIIKLSEIKMGSRKKCMGRRSKKIKFSTIRCSKKHWIYDSYC